MMSSCPCNSPKARFFHKLLAYFYYLSFREMLSKKRGASCFHKLHFAICALKILQTVSSMPIPDDIARALNSIASALFIVAKVLAQHFLLHKYHLLYPIFMKELVYKIISFVQRFRKLDKPLIQ